MERIRAPSPGPAVPMYFNTFGAAIMPAAAALAIRVLRVMH
jgi:hypothetical protein